MDVLCFIILKQKLIENIMNQTVQLDISRVLLIALESAIADNENYLIKYDSLKNPSEPWMYNSEPFKYWMQDHTLRTAIQN